VYASSTTALATGSALTFDGTNLGIGTSSPSSILQVVKSTAQTDIDSSAQVLLLENTATDTAGNLTGIRFRQSNGTNAGQAFLGLSSTGNSATRGSLVFAPPNTSGNATERARIDSSGNLLVGTTSTSGSVSNYGTVVGGLFKSFSGVTASTPSGTFVTLFTASSQFSGYIVTVYIAANDVNNYQSVVMVNTQAGSSTKVSVIVSSGLLSFQMSGYNLQAAQSSGNASTISYSAIRIAA
jgi:hypothetical protein